MAEVTGGGEHEWRQGESSGRADADTMATKDEDGELQNRGADGAAGGLTANSATLGWGTSNAGSREAGTAADAPLATPQESSGHLGGCRAEPDTALGTNQAQLGWGTSEAGSRSAGTAEGVPLAPGTVGSSSSSSNTAKGGRGGSGAAGAAGVTPQRPQRLQKPQRLQRGSGAAGAAGAAPQGNGASGAAGGASHSNQMGGGDCGDASGASKDHKLIHDESHQTGGEHLLQSPRKEPVGRTRTSQSRGRGGASTLRDFKASQAGGSGAAGAAGVTVTPQSSGASDDAGDRPQRGDGAAGAAWVTPQRSGASGAAGDRPRKEPAGRTGTLHDKGEEHHRVSGEEHRRVPGDFRGTSNNRRVLGEEHRRVSGKDQQPRGTTTLGNTKAPQGGPPPCDA